MTTYTYMGFDDGALILKYLQNASDTVKRWANTTINRLEHDQICSGARAIGEIAYGANIVGASMYPEHLPNGETRREIAKATLILSNKENHPDVEKEYTGMLRLHTKDYIYQNNDGNYKITAHYISLDNVLFVDIMREFARSCPSEVREPDSVFLKLTYQRSSAL